MATTVIGTSMTWPGSTSLKAHQESSTDPTVKTDAKPAGNPAKDIHVTKIGNTTPTEETMEVAHCLTVSGVGRMPKGYWLWVANNFDIDGLPEVGSYNSMQRVMQPEGRTSWATAKFGVGERANKKQIIWIHVFLLPQSTDARLKQVHGGAWGISGSYAGTKPVAEYKVRQDGTGDC